MTSSFLRVFLSFPQPRPLVIRSHTSLGIAVEGLCTYNQRIQPIDHTVWSLSRGAWSHYISLLKPRSSRQRSQGDPGMRGAQSSELLLLWRWTAAPVHPGSRCDTVSQHGDLGSATTDRHLCQQPLELGAGLPPFLQPGSHLDPSFAKGCRDQPAPQNSQPAHSHQLLSLCMSVTQQQKTPCLCII